MGHHTLKRDVRGVPAPAHGNGGCFRAEAVNLLGGWRERPGVMLSAHTGKGEGHAVAVACPGVGRQIHAVGVQPVNGAVSTDDCVVMTWSDPVVSRRCPVQVDRRGHRKWRSAPLLARNVSLGKTVLE